MRRALVLSVTLCFVMLSVLVNYTKLDLSATDAVSPLTFIHITDTQFGTATIDNEGRNSTARQGYLAEALNNISDSFEFVILSGDIVCGDGSLEWQWKLFDDWLNACDFEVYCVRGNHDGDLTTSYFEDHTGNEICYVFEDRGIRFAFLGGWQYPERYVGGVGSVFSNDEKNWLLNELKNHQNSSYWIVCHFPVEGANGNYWMTGEDNSTVDTDFYDSVMKYRILGYSCGHEDSYHNVHLSTRGFVHINAWSIDVNNQTKSILPIEKIQIFKDKITVTTVNLYTNDVIQTETFEVETTLDAPIDTPDLPIHIHLTWQTDTSTTIAVTWQTDSSASGDIVLYDNVSRGGVPGDYYHSATGINYTYGGASGYIHEAKLTGLTPDTTYYFICGGQIGGYSNERSFRTAPTVSSDIRFVAGGDSRTNWAEREKISKMMAKFNPVFVLHSGDMVNDGRVQGQWDSWFTDVESHWIGENNLTIPIIPVLGNHENPQDADCKYFEQFALPNNEKWYSYDWGPDIHITCLDSENSASGAQRDWLENDLASHVNYTWKFVQFHRPPFVSGNHSPWMPALTYWVPLFDKYHVDIVFSGHEHSYQRTYPINWTASQNDSQDYSNGTMYIISGGWGAPIYNPKPIWYMAYQNNSYHFCLVDVFRNGTLHLQAKDNLGNTFDEVIICKLPVHDVAIVDVTCSPIEVAIGESISINVTVTNQGNVPEKFGVTVYHDANSIGNQVGISLNGGESDVIPFSWDTTGTAEGTYTIGAEASQVLNEINVTNNKFIDGTVTVTALHTPIASFEFSPTSPSVGDTVTFNASASYDPDGTIVSYHWGFGDNTSATEISPIATHIYVEIGSYTLTLEVTDNDGFTKTITKDITVSVSSPFPLEIIVAIGIVIVSVLGVSLHYYSRARHS